jgi:hypothetical protein
MKILEQEHNMNSSDFLTKLKQGPAVLLLGQGYLSLETGIDPLISDITKKYTNNQVVNADYNQLLQSTIQQDAEASVAWMAQRCEKIFIPEWLKTVASFSWNSVYTSSIDNVWTRAFRMDWRDLQLLCDPEYQPLDTRNRTKLLCTYLFGCVERSEPKERPPLSLQEFRSRRRAARTLLERLPTIVTPVGVLVVEGYGGAKDWLDLETLATLIYDTFYENQVHMFSVTDKLEKELKSDITFNSLISEGRVILHYNNLATTLLQAEIAGHIQLNAPPDDNTSTHHISINEKVCSVPYEIWNQTIRSAIVLDQTVLTPAVPFSKERRYAEFRNFLSDSSNRPIWSGYTHNFAFPREFENSLYNEVHRRLKQAELRREPIILHGQTGTGKTVGLGALAYKLRKEGRYPVLFIERRSQKPINTEIDSFCKWAEDNGAFTIIIIWDGMIDVDAYYEFHNFLDGRGRKVLLIGSCYKIENRKTRSLNPNYIEAPSNLTPTEISGFKHFLEEFDSDISTRLTKELTKSVDYNFLVALYRLLPPSRSLLRTGIVREYGLTEQKLQKQFQEERTSTLSNNILTNALIKSGVFAKFGFNSSTPNEDLIQIGGEQFNNIQKLIGFIMVPGSFGLSVPIEILMRTLDNTSFSDFITLINTEDIFRWYEDARGNITIGPRHQLEASTYTRVRLGGTKSEIEFAKQVLSNIQDKPGLFNENTEIEFAVAFIQKLRPDENDPNRSSDTSNTVKYRPFYRELSETLTGLRVTKGVQNPRIMLQEANLLRQYIVHEKTLPLNVKDQILDKAESIIRSGLENVDTALGGSKSFRTTLHVELACIIGTKMYNHIHAKSDANYVKQLYQQVYQQVLNARLLDTDNYYAVDTLAWNTSELVRSNILDNQEQIDIGANILHTFEMLDPEKLSPSQREKYFSRLLDLNDLLNKQSLSDEAFKALIEMGSTSGYYIRAVHKAGKLPTDKELTKEEIKRCQNAVDYLQTNFVEIRKDGRCVYLLLRLWWLSIVGKPMFYDERQVVPFSARDWAYTRDLIYTLMSHDQIYASLSLQFLYAVANFHLGNYEEALTVFKDIERDKDYLQGHRRIARSYLSSFEGKASVYTGYVYWVNQERSKGEVAVTQIGRNVSFVPRDFNRPDIRKGDDLGKFYIAFNFRGPIADPINSYKLKES